jgi:hypothetical protein
LAGRFGVGGDVVPGGCGAGGVSVICDRCGKPDPSEAIARQQAQMMPRKRTEGLAVVAHRDAFQWRSEPADIRVGDIVRVTLIAGAVSDITAGFYCECEDAA